MNNTLSWTSLPNLPDGEVNQSGYKSSTRTFLNRLIEAVPLSCWLIGGRILKHTFGLPALIDDPLNLVPLGGRRHSDQHAFGFVFLDQTVQGIGVVENPYCINVDSQLAGVVVHKPERIVARPG